MKNKRKQVFLSPEVVVCDGPPLLAGDLNEVDRLHGVVGDGGPSHQEAEEGPGPKVGRESLQQSRADPEGQPASAEIHHIWWRFCNWI